MINAIIASLSKKIPFERPILIIFTGESNSGGQALNVSATFSELLPRYKVRPLNNTTLKFEDLHIGVNNNIGHTGGINSATNHGWELQLAARCEAEDLPALPIFTCKTGQGGSTISQWNVGGAYYTTFLERVNAAIGMLAEPRVFVWYSQGINDSIAETAVTTWKSATIAHIDQIRTDLGITDLDFIVPYLPGTGLETFNTAWDEIDTADANVHVVSIDGAEMGDSYHWNYAGMKVIANNLIDKTLELL